MRAVVEQFRSAAISLHRVVKADGSSAWRGPQGMRIEWTRCHYGRGRPWLVCPCCGARRARLFALDRSRIECRECLGLAYLTQRVPPMRRVQIRQERLRARLGGSGAPGEGFPEKPSQMHWRTYERLQCLHEQLEDKVDAIWAPPFAARVAKMDRRRRR